MFFFFLFEIFNYKLSSFFLHLLQLSSLRKKKRRRKISEKILVVTTTIARAMAAAAEADSNKVLQYL